MHSFSLRRWTLFWLVLILPMVCLPFVVQSAPVAASAPATPTATTPELIDQAFVHGDISADQRLLLLTYAVYEPARVPARFIGRGGWSGSMIVREINRARQQLAAGQRISPALQAELQSISPQAATVCDREDGANTIETAHFHIAYDSIQMLTPQQYADAIESTFATEITSFGWAKPPLSANNPFGKYPVQIAALGNELYGYVTSPGGAYTGPVGDNPNTAATETAALASCMVVNSDVVQFAGGDTAAGLNALKVTMAHEYFHAVQYGYGDPGSEEEVVWFESTAAYVEDEVLPDAHDNYQYLYPDVTVSLPLQADETQRYSFWPLFRYASEQNGGLGTPNGGENLMGLLFANIGAGQPALTAYDNALKATGSTLNNTFQAFAASLRLLKPCAQVAQYCFSDADSIRTKAGKLPQNQGTIAAIGDSYNSTIADTYAINWVSLPATGSYAIDLTNTAAGGQLQASIVADVGSSGVVTAVQATAEAGQTISVPMYQAPAGATAVVLVITNQAVSANLSAPAARTYTIRTALPRPTTSFFLPLIAQ